MISVWDFSDREVKDLCLSDVQIATKSNCESTTSTSAITSAIPSPSSSSVIAPLSNHHEPLLAHNPRPSASHQLPSSHCQHIDSHLQSHQMSSRLDPLHSHSNQALHHADKTTPLDQHIAQIPNSFQPSIEQYDQPSYGNHYNSPGVIHPPSMNSHHNMEYNDYYSGFYTTYDDQMRPYSASSNSCSSSNSDGDSQMASHHHTMQQHLNSNQDHPHNRLHNSHQPNVMTGPIHGTLPTRTNGTLDAANVSPNDYSDCMDRSSHQSYELNCFSGLGNLGIQHFTDDLHSNHGAYATNTNLNHSNSILLNGNASSGGSVLFNSSELTASQTVTDSIQYASVIVEPNNFHMTNEYVH